MSSTSAETPDYRLCLYVMGSSDRSARAIVNVRRLCEQHLQGRYQLEVVDIAQRPDIARDQQLIAAPTLVRHAPLPQRRLIGDMSESLRVLSGLGLPMEAAG